MVNFFRSGIYNAAVGQANLHGRNKQDTSKVENAVNAFD